MADGVREEERAVEALADLAHEQWSGWVRSLFSKCELNDDSTVTIPAWAARRLARQVCTTYASLSEEEQESDRREARKVLAKLRETGVVPGGGES